MNNFFNLDLHHNNYRILNPGRCKLQKHDNSTFTCYASCQEYIIAYFGIFYLNSRLRITDHRLRLRCGKTLRGSISGNKTYRSRIRMSLSLSVIFIHVKEKHRRCEQDSTDQDVFIRSGCVVDSVWPAQ